MNLSYLHIHYGSVPYVTHGILRYGQHNTALYNTVQLFLGMPFMEQPCDCCVKQSYIDDRDDEGQVPNTIDDNEYDSDFDEAALDELETIDVATLPLLPDFISIKDLIDDIRTKKPITHKQKEINGVCDSLVEPFVEIFLSKHIEKIETLLPEGLEHTGDFHHQSPPIFVLSQQLLQLNWLQFKSTYKTSSIIASLLLLTSLFNYHVVTYKQITADSMIYDQFIKTLL